MQDEVYGKLQKIRDSYYFSHPVFKYLFNKDASIWLKAKIREKQLEVMLNKLPQEQYRRFLKSDIETILYELLEEIKIKDAKDPLAKAINQDANNAQKILKTIDDLLSELQA